MPSAVSPSMTARLFCKACGAAVPDAPDPVVERRVVSPRPRGQADTAVKRPHRRSRGRHHRHHRRGSRPRLRPRRRSSYGAEWPPPSRPPDADWSLRRDHRGSHHLARGAGGGGLLLLCGVTTPPRPPPPPLRHRRPAEDDRRRPLPAAGHDHRGRQNHHPDDPEFDHHHERCLTTTTEDIATTTSPRQTLWCSTSTRRHAHSRVGDEDQQHGSEGARTRCATSCRP